MARKAYEIRRQKSCDMLWVTKVLSGCVPMRSAVWPLNGIVIPTIGLTGAGGGIGCGMSLYGPLGLTDSHLAFRSPLPPPKRLLRVCGLLSRFQGLEEWLRAIVKSW